jgi:uncharacterized membrane protein
MAKAFTIKPEPAKEPAHEDAFAHIEILLGKVLRIGVLMAASIIILGVILFFAREHGDVTYDQALGKGADIHSLSPGTIWNGLRHGSSRDVIFLGVLALILTPITRVAMTVWLFLRQRDWIFVACAGFVLIVLVLGIAGIGV